MDINKMYFVPEHLSFVKATSSHGHLDHGLIKDHGDTGYDDDDDDDDNADDNNDDDGDVCNDYCNISSKSHNAFIPL